MTPSPRDWDELHLAENPAVEVLQHLGYTYVAPELLDPERGNYRSFVLADRLAAAVKRLNPWLSPENVKKAVHAVTSQQAASTVEASEKVYVALTHGISVEQDRGKGKKGQTVRFIDFDDPAKNDLVVTRQFKVQGAKKNCILDVVLFVNGLPLVVIECKSPKLGDKWADEAITQLLRYQEVGDEWKDQGIPKLFEIVQVIIAGCGQAAKYGTVGTPARIYSEWKQPYPLTEADLEKSLGRKPTPQDVLLFGMLAPANLLDLSRNFTVFEREQGRTLRKLARYQQLRAVNRSLERVHKARKPADRGGVVWATQGSGKSLTMVWLALKLRCDPKLDNPTIVVVTDRTDLDDQIMSTFSRCGFPNPEQAGSVAELRTLLRGAKGKTILTTVQKFQELTGRGEKGPGKRDLHPVLNEAENLFALVDEAHRTQYKGLATNLRRALPNACFFGFTGTPIDKRDRSTLQTFGPYLDQYTIEQAVADGATVPIFYEGRLPELRIIGQTLDKVFDRVFADRSEEEREAIKKRYATEEAIAAAPKRIEAIGLDIIDHYTKFIQPNGFKAQVVAISREAAVAYKEALDRLNAPPSAVIFSAQHNDEAGLAKFHTSKEERDKLIEKFKDPRDPLAILCVCDMLLTGFDAPVEQVMYLDSPLREHTLLQAIARVNRPADKKTYGLVVDYWGVSQQLQEALAIFSPSDVEGAMKPKVDELPRLQARHRNAMKFFDRVRKKSDLDQCIGVIEPEDVRADFDAAFKGFAQSMDMLLPDPRALPYLRDLKWLGEIRQAAKARFHDGRLDLSGCGAKVRELIEEAIVAEGIQVLVKEVSIFSKDFEEKVEMLRSAEARASEMEHAIRHEIHVRLEENPAFYGSLKARLEQLIEERKQERISQAEQLKLLKALVQEVRNEAKAAEETGLSPMGYAILGLLAPPATVKAAERQAIYGAQTELASLIEESIEPQLGIVDWHSKDDVQREMRKRIKRQLRATGMDAEKVEDLAGRIVDLAKARRRA